MPNYNRTEIMGHVGKFDGVQFDKAGKPRAKFSVAVSDGVGDKKHTEWFNCTAFDKQAEWVGEANTAKGDLVFVVGRLKTREYEGKRYTDLLVSEFRWLRKPNEQKQQPAAKPESFDYGPAPVSDDEMPF